MESEARNPYTALKRRYATLQRNALHVQNALVRPLHALHLQLHKHQSPDYGESFNYYAAVCLPKGFPFSFPVTTCLYIAIARICTLNPTTLNLQDDIASALERAAALASWADPFATALALLACLCAAVLVATLGLSPVLAFAMCWLVRMPVVHRLVHRSFIALQERQACMSLLMSVSAPRGYLNTGLHLQPSPMSRDSAKTRHQPSFKEAPQRQGHLYSAPVLFCVCLLHVQVPALSACVAHHLLIVQAGTDSLAMAS